MSKSSPPKITYVTLAADDSIHPKFEEALKRFENELGRHYPMYIDGKETKSDLGEFEHRSPIDTDIIVGHFQVGNQVHARSAIEAADVAFQKWRSTDWEERVRIMKRAADLIDERKYEIAVAITYEVGKNRLEALAEAWEAVDAIRYYANVMEQHGGYETRMGPGGPGEQTTVVAKPLGVWPVISPFNFPFMLANGMALGALITGNTIILKPTSEAPLTGLMLYRIFKDAGIPTGVVNYVTGPGGNFEKEFVSNPAVAGIAFTGSRDVGMRLYKEFLAQQPYPKPVVMEMGSKNPAIVTSKADLSKAVEGIVRAAFGYDGQKCSAASRVYVQNTVKSKFLDGLKARVQEIRVGDPRKKDTFNGPVINKAAIDRFQDAVEDARNSKGIFLVGGRVLKVGSFARGFYVEPTVVTDLPGSHRLFRDELFLPFIVVDYFETLEEALQKANATEYGLTAGIFSEDSSEVRRFFDGIEFGVVYANRKGGATTGAWPGAQSFVGWKASGATGRGIGGPHYLLTFLREQSQTLVSD
ncbi:MAG: aldehyde dehydrogenase family protein [Thaumarchaeota archaeon]|nr:aldehyde dehydrogenase family protein [Nitrososphaerota archaeon]